ncbi:MULTISPECIES: TAXI family TRAP transporter solute-binding subunit [Bradyrhizobium]|jgi:TRAP transporter TAXI family solute receptor|uniref:TRAP transporter solute receptor, TAXI family n=2 Tax=Bradyrhizobium TaxID=374 RepID=A0ABY0PPB0_9BRAD|nr:MULTISPECIES: TAXI family TRAP transporter solute-binding subunit [Bradyrhizobium]SDI71895.1 TRAP transporter solute receptor, TAXI family [Bradyrhizobium ottawaense]SED26160.1 TRAP transporter solute receptor, TAXI family [Bradyrhizobium lablabi]SHL29844.1 TRAP transporter solute receptor, TAXI family [Bradyrhizobium lablabi]
MRRLFGMALIAIMMVCGQTARAEETQLDPAKVSESLKAIFQFGSAATKQALNQNTVTLISGTIGGTYVQIGADLASVLDDGNKLRVLPIVGRGSVQSVADILFLQGVDLGIVRADTLDYLERKGFAKDIKKQFTYVTKLYNEEMYVIASKSVRSLADLNGKKVSVDLPNGGTFVTASIVFERLGLKPNLVYIEQRISMEMLKKGEIDAVIAVGGKPYKSVSAFKDDKDRFHFVPVDYAKPLQGDYLPAMLTAKDYPNLIAEGERVDTIAVPAVLAAYNWAPNTERYRKLALFVDAFFTKFPTFQNPPFHPKWKEVSLSAPLQDWQRLPIADQWLKSHNIEAVTRARFDDFLKQSPTTAASVKNDTDREALFKQFQAWEADKNARAQVVRPAATAK